MSHSQGREEEIIAKATWNLPAGSVIDIGAYDGDLYSNSFALIARGWNALCVEPSPWAFARLAELYAGNPRVTLLNAAIGVDTRIVKFWDCAGEPYSTTVEAQLAKWPGRIFRPYWVPQITIATMLAQLGSGADVLSIDCEGSSVDILMSCPIGSWAPRVIVVEHDARAIELTGWANERGYEIAQGGLNAENIILVKR